LSGPNAVAWNAAHNRLIIADTGNCLVRALSFPMQVVATLAGNRTCVHSGDGRNGTLASIDSPRGLSVDAAGNIFIAFYSTHSIRMLWANGTIITILGRANIAGTPGNLQAAGSALFNAPRVAAVDSHGHLW
jgi:sugar lactone lactonase YvrE